MEKTTRSLDDGRSLTLDEAGRLYAEKLRIEGRSEDTVKAVKNALAQFGKVWGGRDVREVTAADLEGFAAALAGRMSRSGAYVYLSQIKHVFRHLAERRLLLVDPAATLPLPKTIAQLAGRILTVEEAAQLVESPGIDTPTGLRDRALLEFLYSTGLRVTEARTLRVADLGDETATVRQGKGAKDRVVPVGTRAMAWVRRYLGEARPEMAAYAPGHEELWLTRWGKPFGECLFQQHLRKLGRAAGFDGFNLTCHVLRRSMATHLLSAGASPAEVAGIMGHADLTSLRRYVRVAVRELKAEHAATHPREQEEGR